MLFSGFGIYFGLIFVFLRSRPTIDVPLGIMTPPFILLSLYNALFSVERSKLVLRSNCAKSEEVVPFLNLKVDDPVGIQPGLLSTT